MSAFQEMFGSAKAAVAALLALAVKAESSEVYEVEQGQGRTGIVLPVDRKWQDLTDELAKREQYLYDLEEKRGPGPRLIESKETAQTLAGFCDLVNRHKSSSTAISARGGSLPSMVATIDYHGESDGESGPAPRWKKHVVRYSFPITEQFQAWRGADKWMGKREFLDFCDQRALELFPPDEADAGPVTNEIKSKLLLAKGGYTRKTAEDAPLDKAFGGASQLLMAARAVRTSTEEKLEEKIDDLGLVSFSYQKKEALESWTAERYYLVSVRVFDGDEKAMIVPVRIDIKIENAHVLFRFVLLGLDLIVENAFATACKKVAESTEIVPIRAVFGGE